MIGQSRSTQRRELKVTKDEAKPVKAMHELVRLEAEALGKGWKDGYDHNRPHAAGCSKDGVRRELAVIGPHGRLVRWLANKP